MSRKLASIQRIVKLEPIPNADTLLKATVLGWEVVIKKGEFKVGDLCVYIEPDSILPDRPEFEFLRSRNFRIKTIKLRGQISQGLCLPLLLPDKFTVGEDVTEIFGIKKYDPQSAQEANFLAQQPKSRIKRLLWKFAWLKRWTSVRLPFPSFIPKTEEPRIQTIPEVFTQIKYGDLPLDITEKLDGQSVTYFLIQRRFLFWQRLEFGVCSRNWLIPKNAANLKTTYWKIAKDYAIEYRLRWYYRRYDQLYALQGEIVGPGIQKNPYHLKRLNFYVFNIFILAEGYAYPINTDTIKNVLTKSLIVKTVPILSLNAPLLQTDIPALVKFASGQSTIADVKREGIVCRNYEHHISFKVINPEYLLEHD